MPDTPTPNVMAAAREILEPDYSLSRDGRLFAYLYTGSDVCSGYPYKCIKDDESSRKKQYCPLSYMKYDNVWKKKVQHCACRDAAFELAVQRLAAIITRHNADAAAEAERVLRVVAEWAAKHIPGCSADYGSDCPFPVKSKCGTEAITHCWLEYWKKEAERCRD